MPTLTVFTPAFNRDHTLPRTYNSLLRQTSHDFEWLVADDGSTDNTRQLVEQWQKEAPFKISYYFQKNQGMHGAHNLAWSHITSELGVCIDSDDWMPEDAVEKIISFWGKYGSSKYAGFMALDITPDNKIIGNKYPDNIKETGFLEYYENGGRGDKKVIYRTEIVRKYPQYPIFEGERYVGLSYLFMLIDKDYKLLVMNHPVVIVDYQPDGSSFNMYRQYWNNPNGFAFFRKIEMQSWKSFRRKFNSCIHYVSSSIITKNRNFIKESPLKMLTILAIPFGSLLYLYIRYKVKINSGFNVKV